MKPDSFHLAAGDGDEDFRQGSASSDAAPTQSDSRSVHPAMSTSDVPTAAPLSSLLESGRSELPRSLYSITGDIKDINTVLVPRIATSAMLGAAHAALTWHGAGLNRINAPQKAWEAALQHAVTGEAS